MTGNPPRLKQPGLNQPRLKLSRTTRRAVLVVHIAAAGAWIGMDLVLGVLVFTAMVTGSTATEALCYQALHLFAIWPIFAAGSLCLASGLLLGLGTNYGVLRYRWVAVKLVLNVVLAGLVPLALRVAVNDATTYGNALAAGGPSRTLTDLIFPPVISSAGLVFATVLSVYKPWGRVRRGARAVPTPEPVEAYEVDQVGASVR